MAIDEAKTRRGRDWSRSRQSGFEEGVKQGFIKDGDKKRQRKEMEEEKMERVS